MKTVIKYHDADHARGRLVGTLVRFAGEPVVVREVERNEGSFTLQAKRISDGQYVTARIEDFDLSPVPLGYIQVDDEAVYAERCPQRRWKQGLTLDNMLNLRNGLGRTREGCPELGYKPLRDTILNVYSSLQEAVEGVIKGTVKSKPFSRRFSVGINGDNILALYYRGRETGFVDKGEIFLNKEQHYLVEELLEALNEAR